MKRKIAFRASDATSSDDRNVDRLKAIWEGEAKSAFAAFKRIEDTLWPET
jgi:hypothetical protein